MVDTHSPPGKMPEHAAHHRRVTLGEPLALAYISHIRCGEHPPNFNVLGKTLCGACRHRRGRGASAVLVRSGTIVPLLRSQNNFALGVQ